MSESELTPTALDDELARRSNLLQRFHPQTEVSDKELAARRQSELYLCGQDFFYWLDNWAWLENPKAKDPLYRQLPFMLWPRQKALASFLLYSYSKGGNPIVNKSREIGATWLAMALEFWMFVFEPGFSALNLSAKEENVDNGSTQSMFGKLRYIYRRLPEWMCPKIEDKQLQIINPRSGALIEGASTSGKSARSTRYAIVVTDEWAHVDKRVQLEVKRALESVYRVWWRISTPNGKGDDFHLSWITAPIEAKIALDWRSDPSRTDQWYKGLLRENGGNLTWDEREQEYNCSFAGVSGLRIWKADRTSLLYTDSQLDNVNPNARAEWFTVAPMDFGSGPSWTCCPWILVCWDRDDSELPFIYIDRELVWQQIGVATIAQDILITKARYNEKVWHVGDPAGVNRESDQESWESNLNMCGVPMQCLPAVYNTPQVMDQMLNEVQLLIDRGRLFVHERCKLMMETIESWEWAVPPGIPIEFVPKDTIKPKKDGWSHPGQALMYGIGAVLRAGRQQRTMAELMAMLPQVPGARAVNTIDRTSRVEQGPQGAQMPEDDAYAQHMKDNFDPLSFADW